MENVSLETATASWDFLDQTVEEVRNCIMEISGWNTHHRGSLCGCYGAPSEIRHIQVGLIPTCAAILANGSKNCSQAMKMGGIPPNVGTMLDISSAPLLVHPGSSQNCPFGHICANFSFHVHFTGQSNKPEGWL